MDMIRFGDIVADYDSHEDNQTCAIYAGGCPSLPGGSKDTATILQKSSIDYIKPDYYGFARSQKQFTPENCIQTIIDTYHAIQENTSYKNVFTQEQKKFPDYQNYVFIGHSFGGRITSMLPKFDQNIETIALIAPQLSAQDYGQLGHPEETVDSFYKIVENGFSQLYRGIDTQERQTHFDDNLGLTPTKQPTILQNTNVFLAHGTADDTIRYRRTQKFYTQIKEHETQKKRHYCERYGLGHGGSMKNASLEAFCYRRDQEIQPKTNKKQENKPI